MIRPSLRVPNKIAAFRERRSQLRARRAYRRGEAPTPSPIPGSGILGLAMSAIRKSGYLTLEKCRARAKAKERSVVEGRPYGSPKTFRHDIADLLNVDLGLDPSGKISFERSLRLARQHINATALPLTAQTRRLLAKD